MFKEGGFYILTKGLGGCFKCLNVSSIWVVLKNVSTGTTLHLHKKSDYFALLNFKECSSLEKELT